jgi:hypothetical protein
VVYYSEDTQELKYSYYDGSVWTTYAAAGFLADSPHLALDASDLPHISLGVSMNGECLVYAHVDGSSLNAQTLDCSNAGFDTSIALDYMGLPHISYRQSGNRGSSSLNYVRLAIPDMTGQWTSLVHSCKNSNKGQKCMVKGTVNIRNIGNGDAKSSFVRFYLSDDPSFDQGDILLKQLASGIVKANKNKIKKLSYAFPLNETASQKFLIAVIDADNAVAEVNEENNVVLSELVP